jgi:hypothetical protein
MSARQPLDWRDPVVSQRQAIRDLDAYSWAPRTANNFATYLSMGVIFGLLPVSFAVWMGLL